ncbi:MAG: hypothetical protein LC790_18160, partial [Actinobacteria bacterium]|nr:hypothetical protein [Actinomycetota bacterium]
RAWATATGRRPSSHAWQPIDLGGEQRWEHEYPRWPPHSLVIAEFGSFPEALRQAGLRLNRQDWRDDEILELLRAFQRSHGRSPTRADWQSTNGGANPVATLVANRFGGWPAALGAAGLSHNGHGPWTPEQIIAALQRFRAERGRPPRAHDLRRRAVTAEGYPSASATQRAFGTFSNAVRSAGLHPGNPPPVSGDDALQALRRFHEENGRYPTAAQWRRAALRPGATTIIRRFGQWSRAIAAAKGHAEHSTPATPR